jgi:hypothetical protein
VWHEHEVIQRVKDGGPDWLPANTPQWIGGRLSFGASRTDRNEFEATNILVQVDDLHERHLSVVSFV